MSENRHTVETSGPNAIEAAKSALQSYDFEDKEVMKVSVEVVVENSINEQTTGGGGYTKSEGRKLKNITQNTMRHYVLWLVGQAGPSTNRGLAESAVNDGTLNRGQITGATTDLYKAMLLDREELNKEGKRVYEYRLTSHGSAELKRLEEPDREEVLEE